MNFRFCKYGRFVWKIIPLANEYIHILKKPQYNAIQSLLADFPDL